MQQKNEKAPHSFQKSKYFFFLVLYQKSMFLYCVFAFHHAWKPRVSPPVLKASVETAMKKIQTDGAVNSKQLRLIGRQLGTDISHKNSDRLIELYGTNGTVTFDQLSQLWERSDTTSPSRYFWLTLDPYGTNGLRTTRPSWNKFASSGMVSPMRIAHYGTGMVSLGIGTLDYVDFVVSGGFPDMTLHDATVHASVHIAAAFFSLFRFHYKWTPQSPWYLWMPTAREANMWPSFLVFSWYLCAMRSDFMQPLGVATFHCDALWFQVYSWVTTLVVLYGGVRSTVEYGENISGVYETRVSNVLQVTLTMVVPILADTLKPIFLAHDPSVLETFHQIVATYPEYSLDYVGLSLGLMYLGNVVCALSSAEHYGAISKQTIGDFGNVITLLITAVAFFGIFSVRDGELAWSLIDVTWKGMCSFFVF